MSTQFRGGEPLVARSLLFVPTNVSRFVEKAHTRGADGYILDLEDSIAAPEKANARRILQDVAATLKGNGVRRIFVRVNTQMRLLVPDLEATVSPLISGVIFPKARSPEHVRMACEMMSQLEAERGMAVGTIRLGARIETADAFFRMDEIAAADPRISSFGLGGEDFSFAIGVEPAIDTLIYPKQRAIIAARAAGVTPMGVLGSGADFSDLDGFRAMVVQSRRFGFEGASCIHPAIVPILNEGFSPTAAEVDHAQRLLDSFYAAGSGASNFEGKMIDYPVAYRAERVLARKRAIDALAN